VHPRPVQDAVTSSSVESERSLIVGYCADTRSKKKQNQISLPPNQTRPISSSPRLFQTDRAYLFHPPLPKRDDRSYLSLLQHDLRDHDLVRPLAELLTRQGRVEPTPPGHGACIASGVEPGEKCEARERGEMRGRVVGGRVRASERGHRWRGWDRFRGKAGRRNEVAFFFFACYAGAG
jgi:hypothetical protein